MTVCADAQDRVAIGEGAPQRAPLPSGPPAGLVHVQRPGATNALEQISVGIDERVGDPLEDRIDRAAADARAEELLAALHDVAARDAVAHRQHRDSGLKARPERAACDLGGQLCAWALAAARAAHARAPVLGHRDRQPGQLLDLMAHRLAHGDQLALTEDVPTRACRRPVHDHLVDRRGRQELPALALMTRLAAGRSARPILAAAPRRCARRIGARRLRRVPRRAAQLTLQLRDPLVLPGDPCAQLLDLHLQPLVLCRQRQQHLNDGIAALPIDRLGLAPLHTPRFDAARLCPPDQLNAYAKYLICRDFVVGVTACRFPGGRRTGRA